MQSLREKLLKAGLVTEEQARKVEAESTRKKASAPAHREGGAERGRERERRQSGPRPPSAPAPERLIPKLPPLPGSKEHQRLESKKQLELDRKLREIVQAEQVAIEPGDQTFYFVTRKGRLRRLEVSEAQAKLLESGALAVVERPEPAQIEHSLVPPETAERMLALQAKAVRFFNRPGSAIGFLSDDELKERQEAEATAGPEEASSAGESSREDAPATGGPAEGAAGDPA